MNTSKLNHLHRNLGRPPHHPTYWHLEHIGADWQNTGIKHLK